MVLVQKRIKTKKYVRHSFSLWIYSIDFLSWKPYQFQVPKFWYLSNTQKNKWYPAMPRAKKLLQGLHPVLSLSCLCLVLRTRPCSNFFCLRQSRVPFICGTFEGKLWTSKFVSRKELLKPNFDILGYILKISIIFTKFR